MMLVNRNIRVGVLLVVFFCICSSAVYARCGETRYDWGADALHEASVFVLVVMEYTVGILYAIASLTAIFSATSIYIKINAGEEGFVKSLMVLVGSILFLIGATIFMPALFDVIFDGVWKFG